MTASVAYALLLVLSLALVVLMATSLLRRVQERQARECALAVMCDRTPAQPDPMPAHDGRQAIHIGFSNDGFVLNGLSVWDHKWQAEPGSVTLPHPAYPAQMHSYGIYSIVKGARRVRFAAEELSNGVWGFYVEQPVA